MARAHARRSGLTSALACTLGLGPMARPRGRGDDLPCRRPGHRRHPGHVRHSGDRSREKDITYRIVVHFTAKAATLDHAQVLVPVKPGKTVPWVAKKQFQAQNHMLCPMPGISVVS